MYQTMKTVCENMFTLFDTIHESDKRTDGQTPPDGISRAAHSVVRQKFT